MSVEELKEELGLKGEYEEYAIHDYELPFEIGEYEPIEEINRRCRMLEDVPQELSGDLKEIIDILFNGDVDDMMKNIEYIHFYSGMESMEELAIF